MPGVLAFLWVGIYIPAEKQLRAVIVILGVNIKLGFFWDAHVKRLLDDASDCPWVAVDRYSFDVMKRS